MVRQATCTAKRRTNDPPAVTASGRVRCGTKPGPAPEKSLSGTRDTTAGALAADGLSDLDMVRE